MPGPDDAPFVIRQGVDRQLEFPPVQSVPPTCLTLLSVLKNTKPGAVRRAGLSRRIIAEATAPRSIT